MTSLCRPTFLALFAAAALARGEDLSVFPAGSGPERFEAWLKGEFYAMTERRSAAFEKMIKSATAMRAWQQERREFFLRKIGGLPERTPLNPQITGTLRGKGYRVEKIILETRPGFHLTGNLYLPETPPPWPAVLVPCGHSHDGKAVGQYQRASILLARNGMAAMCYDPIGQGERYQILDLAREHDVFEDAPHVATPHPNARLMCTTEHTMIGLSSALLGANVAQFRIWDGMRVIDYLQSRPDMIADRIGCTGNSGGGTETAYLMALDERIVAAAPGCYLTTFRKLIDTKGPQDGEQNIFSQIAFGMDEADYCIMRAPRPTLICAGTRDVTFDFAGTMDVFRDAKRFYSRLGYPERLDIAAPDAPHGFTLQLREAVASWMSRWLLGKDVAIREVDALPDSLTDEQLRAYNEPDWTADQLRCTPKGQVLFLPGERSAFQINASLAADLREKRTPAWGALSHDAKCARIRETIGAREGTEPKIECLTTIRRSDCAIQKLALAAAPGVRVPALAFIPEKPIAATLYLHGTSMKADAAPDGPIAALVARGHIVLAAELRGIGETETGHGKRAFGAGRFGPDNLEILTAYLMGKSFVGMRTEDVLAWTHYLRSPVLTGTAPASVDLVAIGEASIPALHAAALQPDAFNSVQLRKMIPSWESIVAAPETFDQSVNVVHGALQHYDLQDLAALLGEKVRITEPVDVFGKPLASALPLLTLPVRVHLVQSATMPSMHTTLTETDVRRIFGKVNGVWSQAGIRFEIESVRSTNAVPPPSDAHSHSEFEQVKAMIPSESLSPAAIDVCYVKEVRPNGFYYGEPIVVKDTAQLREVPGGIDEPLPRVTSHEIGHALGLRHRQDVTNLMASGTTGTSLNEAEIVTARTSAQERLKTSKAPAPARQPRTLPATE